MYRNNSDMGGKYKRTGDFMRLVRSIETYPQYVAAGDIVELTRADAERASASGETDADIASVFKETRQQPIMLINATAQVALTHHLDDEVSKNASVAVNRKAVEQAHVVPAVRHVRVAKELLDTFIAAGRLLGTDEAMARTIAVDQVRKHTGLDMTQLLATNAVEEAPMTPTELGKEFGLGARKMNTKLEDEGFQEKDEHGEWRPTEKGKPHCTLHPYKSPNSDHVGYRVLWYRSVLEALTAAA